MAKLRSAVSGAKGGKGGKPGVYEQYTTVRGKEVPGHRLAGADSRRAARAVLPLPAGHPGAAGRPGPRRRAGHRRGADRAAGAAGRAHDAGRGAAGARRRPHRPAPLGRPARPAHPGPRRGRPRAAGRRVQPDGGQPAAPDRTTGRDVAAAAAVHLGRVARTAHPADHRADGGRPAVLLPGRLRPGRGPQRRAVAGRAQPLREPADRPAGDQPVRRRVRRAGRRADRSRVGRAAGRRPARPRWPSAATWRCGYKCRRPR